MTTDHSNAENALKENSRSRRVLRKIAGPLIAIATLILVLGGLELVAFFWENNTAQGPLGWTLVASRRMPLERYGLEDQSYYLLEPDQDYNWESIPVHINSRGLRTEEFDIHKPPDTYRILNLGDSIVFGWEVRQEDTYGERLASLLNERDDSIRYEIINAGVPAWNLETSRNFLLQEGLSYDPDLVLLDITIANDIYGGGPGALKRLALIDWLRDNTHFWPFLTTQIRFLLAKQMGPEAIPELNPGLTADWYFPLGEEDHTWNNLWDTIAAIDKATRDQGAELIIVAFPTALQVNSSAHPDVPQRVFAKRAGEAGIKFIDLLPVYKQVCESAEAEACEGFENILFADVWMHPTPLGHQLATQQIVEALSE